MENQLSGSVHRLADLDQNLHNKQSKTYYIQKNQKLKSVSFRKLFRFATPFDILLMTLGTIAAILFSAANPAYALMWGKMAEYYSQNNQNIVNNSRNIMFIFFGVAIAVLLFGWIMYSFWMITGKRQANACRKAYLKALLNQQIGWFDTVKQLQLTSNFSNDCQAYEGAIGEKNGYVLTIFGMITIGIGVASSKGWLMTLVIFWAVPIMAITGFLYLWGLRQKQINSQQQYSHANGLAQQALASIKTIKMLNGETFQAFQYRKKLEQIQKKCLKYTIVVSVGAGLLTAMIFFSYSFGYWYGSHCIQGTNVCKSNQFYNIQNVIVIFVCILIEAINISQLAPAMKKMAEGRLAAARIFRIIDRQPLIKNVQNGLKPKNVKGEIRFHNVSFSYPKQPNKKILNNISFTIDKLSNAFVGESGCGKSTIFQLLLRFYDPDEGKITLDGVDIKQLDLNWLRQNIGYVGQQPVLFATSIRQNLIFGKEDVTDEEIYEALKKAEAYDFVQSLSQKLDTFVGNGGGQLSGGQKQRIAIARALLRNPKVLLLDEATSALDRKNERLIQKTLQNISKERVTISIAHRIKTIEKCQMIYVLQKGSISEQGSFKSLKKFQLLNQQISQLETKKFLSKFGFKFFNKKKNQKQNIVSSNSIQENKKQMIQHQIIDKQQINIKTQQKIIQNGEQQQQKHGQSVFIRIFSLNSSFLKKFVLILLLAVLNGLTFPIFAFLLAKLIVILMQYSEASKHQYRQDANLYCLLLLIIGLISFVINFIKNFFFYRVGEKITNNIRCSVYQKMLKMPIEWFDDPNNNCGKLVGKLSTDCKSIEGLTTNFIGLFVQNITTLIGSIVIALIFSWKITLAVIGLVPFVALVGFIQMTQNSSTSKQMDQLQKQSLNLVLQAVTNIRTVISLGFQKSICLKQEKHLQQPYRLFLKKAIWSGLFYGLSQCTIIIILSMIFFIGTIFVKNYGVTVEDSFISIYQLIYGSYFIGINFVFLPDVGKTKAAAQGLFKIIDLEDEDQLQIKQQSKLLNRGIEGNIQLKNISFKYKNRNEQLFTDFNLKINKGTKVAFVGHSGCGKSTIIQMLLRFYDPSSGQILIDGNDIKDYDIHYLRKQLGVVSQEPVLFNQSFRYNIIYNQTDMTEQRMITATKQANAYEVIKNNRSTEESLSNEKGKEKSQDEKKKVDDFDRNVGIKGSHISGGQKQRIAIARTILRNPCVLLLDEATSALDNENEKKVQESLDRIMKGKTTISIAHRTQTIKNSDKIYVFDKGKIIEQGNYNQLISKQNHFYQLQKDGKTQ